MKQRLVSLTCLDNTLPQLGSHTQFDRFHTSQVNPHVFVADSVWVVVMSVSPRYRRVLLFAGIEAQLHLSIKPHRSSHSASSQPSTCRWCAHALFSAWVPVLRLLGYSSARATPCSDPHQHSVLRSHSERWHGALNTCFCLVFPTFESKAVITGDRRSFRSRRVRLYIISLVREFWACLFVCLFWMKSANCAIPASSHRGAAFL